MEIIIHVCALILTFVLAAVKTAQYLPNGLSDFELERQAQAGHTQAAAEQKRRSLLPTFIALKTVKEVVLTVALVGLLVSTHQVWTGLSLALLYLFIAEIIATKGLLIAMVRTLQQKVEPKIIHHVERANRAVNVLAPKIPEHTQFRVNSRDELQELIDASGHVITAEEKAQLLACLTFNNQKISDRMVRAEHIITADSKETVGPILLDRLHKAGHKIFPVVKKDLQHIQGLLYMGDILEKHPEVKKVADATRPAVYYLPQDASLVEVVSASLQTGRQFFLVKNNAEEVVGLITLADVIREMLGRELPTQSQVTARQ